MSDNFLVKNAGLCFFVWLIFLVGGYSVTFDLHPHFSRGWMVIWGGVFIACITALLAFDNMNKIAIKNQKREQYFSYYELLTILQEWLQFTQRIRREIEPSMRINTSDRIFSHSKIMVDSSFSRIDFAKIVFVNKALSSDFSNDDIEVENYDCFNVGNLSAAEYNFFGFVSVLKQRNKIYDKHIKIAMCRARDPKFSFEFNNEKLKNEVSYIDFTDYIQLTEAMFSLSDQLIRHLDYLINELVKRSEEVIDVNVANENGGLPKLYNINHQIDLSLQYIPLSNNEHRKLRDIYN